LLSNKFKAPNSIELFLLTGILLISGRAIKIYTLQKKILITATDIFAFRVKSNLKNSLKSISISTRKQLGTESFAT
jgi:hypothetical protein